DEVSAGGAAGSGRSDVRFSPPADPIEDGNGHTLRKFVGPSDPGPGGFVFTVSGEVNALTGYPFPPFDPSATWMVDGWSWRIDELIVVVDHITLWNDPNRSPSDQSQHGSQVAHVDGPFVVDLHKGGPVPGAGGAGEQALAIAALDSQNDSGGSAFDAATRYAFGFSTVPAPGDGTAINVNLDATERDDFQAMVRQGYSVFYSGTATWAGDQAGPMGFPGSCTPTTTSAGPYDFTRLPRTMAFKLGFSTPTRYVNCVDYTARSVRGVQTSPTESALEQITLHMDHPFWESFTENSPVHWDAIAAQYVGVTDPVARIEDMKGVPFSPFTDSTGTVLPWRSCESLYVPPGNGAMSFGTLSVPQDPHGTCTGAVGQDFSSARCSAIRDYYDYLRFTQSSQGHLNSQGACFVDRQYPAPAGGS
ncbi:MAG: hypothetical protein ACRENE_25390, partial [Polyangiaceae bacterium]